MKLTIEKTQAGYSIEVESGDVHAKQQWTFDESGAHADVEIDSVLESIGPQEDRMGAWEDLHCAIYSFMEAMYEDGE